MLNLDLGIGKKIVIDLPCGKSIVLRVNRIDRKRVRLGFTADRSISIWRKEIHDEMKKEEKSDE